jgi:hypothetical protein
MVSRARTEAATSCNRSTRPFGTAPRRGRPGRQRLRRSRRRPRAPRGGPREGRTRAPRRRPCSWSFQKLPAHGNICRRMLAYPGPGRHPSAAAANLAWFAPPGRLQPTLARLAALANPTITRRPGARKAGQGSRRRHQPPPAGRAGNEQLPAAHMAAEQLEWTKRWYVWRAHCCASSWP